VLAAGVADVVVFSQTALWVGNGTYLALAYLLFSAFGAGWFAAHRSAFAGGLSVLLGAVAAAIFGFVTATSVQLGGANALDLLGWALSLSFWALPYAVGGALAGAAGGWLRGRALRRA
jgi:hypothetical protein